MEDIYQLMEEKKRTLSTKRTPNYTNSCKPYNNLLNEFYADMYRIIESEKVELDSSNNLRLGNEQTFLIARSYDSELEQILRFFADQSSGQYVIVSETVAGIRYPYYAQVENIVKVITDEMQKISEIMSEEKNQGRNF